MLPGSQAADRESFVRQARAVHVAAARLEPSPSFPLSRSLKCQIIGRTRMYDLLCPPFRFPPLLFLDRERLDRFLSSPLRMDACRCFSVPRLPCFLNESEREHSRPAHVISPNSFVLQCIGKDRVNRSIKLKLFSKWNRIGEQV